MKKKIIALMMIIAALSITGCRTEPKIYGQTIDWSEYDNEDNHVFFAFNDNGFYSDGSYSSNKQYDVWLAEYKRMHE